MYERRLLRLFFLLAAFLAVALGRAFQIQVVRADDILRERETVFRSTSVIQPRRGEILWSDGTPAVRNASRFVLRIDVPTFDAPRKRCGACGDVTTRRERDLPSDACAECGTSGKWSALPAQDPALLASLLGLGTEEVTAAIEEARKTNKSRRWRSIQLLPERRFSAETCAAVALRAADLRGVTVVAEPWREADPEIREFAGGAHVAYDTDVKELTAPERAERGLHVYTEQEALRVLVGHGGLEMRRDEELRGIPGILERPASRRGEPPPAAEVVREVVDGKDIRTTLRRDVQRVAQEVVASSAPRPGFDGAVSAAAVVMDLRDGAVIAMASRADDAYFRPIVAMIPGSVFKLVTALAMLEAGIDPDATVDCEKRGWLRPGQKYTCTGYHPGIGFTDAFGKSCNYYFMRRAEEAGPLAMRAAYERLGFAEEVRLGVGVAPKRAFISRWENYAAQLGIGQAHALATPLQIATAFGRAATARRIVPYVDRDVGPSKSAREVDPVLARHASLLTEAARRTVTVGTARDVPELAALDAAGKSGTGEVELKDDRRKNNAWFAAFAPSAAPRYVVVVLHEQIDKEHGASYAGPGAARLLQAAFATEAAAPPTESARER